MMIYVGVDVHKRFSRLGATTGGLTGARHPQAESGAPWTATRVAGPNRSSAWVKGLHHLRGPLALPATLAAEDGLGAALRLCDRYTCVHVNDLRRLPGGPERMAPEGVDLRSLAVDCPRLGDKPAYPLAASHLRQACAPRAGSGPLRPETVLLLGQAHETAPVADRCVWMMSPGACRFPFIGLSPPLTSLAPSSNVRPGLLLGGRATFGSACSREDQVLTWRRSRAAVHSPLRMPPAAAARRR
jgi:hypothetical protein